MKNDLISQKEQILDLMDKNIEIRLGVYTPVKPTPFDRIFKWVKKLFN
jgi:hypothetical protein